MTKTRTWRDQAACRDEDPETFFPAGESAPYQQQVAEAVAVCRRCPVIRRCFAWAVEAGQEQGIWGGTTEHDRMSYRRRRSDAARKNGATA